MIRTEVEHFLLTDGALLVYGTLWSQLGSSPPAAGTPFAAGQPQYHQSPAIFPLHWTSTHQHHPTTHPWGLLCRQSDWTSVTATGGYGRQSTWCVLTVTSTAMVPSPADTHPRAVRSGPGQPTPYDSLLAEETVPSTYALYGQDEEEEEVG